MYNSSRLYACNPKTLKQAKEKIVDADVESITKDETDPDKAYESYVCFGDDPWIEGIDFSALEYAKLKILEVLKG